MEFICSLLLLGCMNAAEHARELSLLLPKVKVLNQAQRDALLGGGTCELFGFTPFGELLPLSLTVPNRVIRLTQTMGDDGDVPDLHIWHIQNGRVVWEFSGPEHTLDARLPAVYPSRHGYKKWISEETSRISLAQEFALRHPEAKCFLGNNGGFHSCKAYWFFTLENDALIRNGYANCKPEPMPSAWAGSMGQNVFRVNPFIFTPGCVDEKEAAIQKMAYESWGR